MTRKMVIWLKEVRLFPIVAGIVVLLLFNGSVFATPLDAFLSCLERRTLQSDFTITISEEAVQPMHYTGSICMRGNCFLLSIFDTEASYDGSTLYLYNSSTDELTLSTPSEQELLEANPFLYAKALKEACCITERASKDPSQHIIVLTPKASSAGIQRFVLRLKHIEGSGEEAVYLPISIEIKEGQQVTTLTLQQAKYTQSTCSFRLDYPDAYLNDLR